MNSERGMINEEWVSKLFMYWEQNCK